MRLAFFFLISSITIVSSVNAMTFRVASAGSTDGSAWIVADGEITPDSADEFRSLYQRERDHLPVRAEVWLNSGGGSLSGGLKLGEAIREVGFGTVVSRSVKMSSDSQFEDAADGKCASACVFAFLGGKFRNAGDRTLGIHQFYLPQALNAPNAVQFTAKDLSDQQALAGILANYVVTMGVDARFLLQVSQTRPDDVYYLTTEEMKKFDILANDIEYSDWAFQLYKDGLIAFSRTKNGERTATLFCRRDRNLKLLLTMPGFGIDASEVAKGALVNFFGAQIESDDITGKTQNGNFVFEFKLPPISAFKEFKYGMGGIGLTSRAYFNQDIPGKDFVPTANMVLRNCY